MGRKLLIVSSLLLFGFCANAAYEVWNQKANFGGIARHRTTSFAIGNKGYIGLGHYNSGPSGNILLSDFWEYDPASDSWTQKADFGGGLRYHSIGFAYGNKAYVGTGRAPGGVLTTDMWEFDPIANTWTPVASFPGSQRRGAVAFVIDQYAFVGTGQTPSGYSNDFYAYDIPNNLWLGGVPSLPGSPRTSACAFVIDGKGYVGTGNVGGGSTDFYEYKPSTNTWIQRADVGTTIRQEAFGFSVNGKGYIGCGDNWSSGTNYKDFWEYDPATDTWKQIEDFGGAARRYLDGFVIGNKAYCGMGTSGVNFNDLWEFDLLLSTIQRDQSYLQISNYPNPAITHTTFELQNLPQGMNYNDVRLYVYNSNGQIIFEKDFESAEMLMERNGLPDGFYLYTITYEGQSIKQGKLIFG